MEHPIILIVILYLQIRIAMIKRKDGFNGERALVLPVSVISEMEIDPLSAILHITDIGYYPNAEFHFRKRDEAISQYVFILLYRWKRLVQKRWTKVFSKSEPIFYFTGRKTSFLWC